MFLFIFSYLEDLDEGVYIQQTMESVLLNDDGKQLMVSNELCRSDNVACMPAVETSAIVNMSQAGCTGDWISQYQHSTT